MKALSVDQVIAYGIRNNATRDVKSVPTTWRKFSILERMLFNILFLIVEFLYLDTDA